MTRGIAWKSAFPVTPIATDADSQTSSTRPPHLRRPFAVLVALMLATFSSSSQAQDAPARAGFWFNASAGFGRIDCENCRGTPAVLNLSLTAGQTISEALLAGIMAGSWINNAERYDGFSTRTGTEMILALAPLLRWYPSARAPISATAGLGLAMGNTDHWLSVDIGATVVAGLAYDALLKSGRSISPYIQYMTFRTSTTRSDVLTAGIGITFH